MAMPQFEDILAFLVYFPIDSTFAVCPLEDVSSWSQSSYAALKNNPFAKTRVEAEFDGKPYSSIIVQCGTSSLCLQAAMEYVIRVKKEKQFSIEKILQLIPSRFVATNKRPQFPLVKVCASFQMCFISYTPFLKIFLLFWFQNLLTDLSSTEIDIDEQSSMNLVKGRSVSRDEQSQSLSRTVLKGGSA
jgi:hypothetical protein